MHPAGPIRIGTFGIVESSGIAAADAGQNLLERLHARIVTAMRKAALRQRRRSRAKQGQQGEKPKENATTHGVF